MSTSLTGFSSLLDELQVNVEASGDQQAPSVAGLAGGGFAAVWRGPGEADETTGIFGQIFDAPAAPVGAEFRVAGSLDNAQAPSVAPLQAGGFVVTWKSDTDTSPFGAILARRFAADGQAEGGALEITAPSDNVRAAPRVVEQADGGLTVVWQSLNEDGSNWGIFSRQIDPSWSVSGSDVQVSWSPSRMRCAKAVSNGQLLRSDRYSC